MTVKGRGGGGALESVSLQCVVNRVIEWLKMVYRDNWGYHYDLVDNLSLSEQIWFLSWFKRYMCFMKCPILPKMSDYSNIILNSVSSLNILESSCFQESRLPYFTGYLHPESCTCEILLYKVDQTHKYENRIKETIEYRAVPCMQIPTCVIIRKTVLCIMMINIISWGPPSTFNPKSNNHLPTSRFSPKIFSSSARSLNRGFHPSPGPLACESPERSSVEQPM